MDWRGEPAPAPPEGIVTETAPITTKAPADPNTGAGLIEFLDAAIGKGWINVGSAKALRTATMKIFEVESGWESIDLRSLDTDSLFDRFRNLRRNTYSDGSMRIYRQRFNQALKMHLAHVDGDANWKSYGPAGNPRPPASGSKIIKKGAAPKDVPNAPADKPTDETDPSVTVHAPGTMPLMRFPFPLRDSVDVWLTLPRDLTSDEADRLSVFIRSLARPAAVPATA
jgi:hypothetical protein